MSSLCVNGLVAEINLYSAFVGLGVIIIMFPIPGYLAKVVQDVQGATLKKTDARVQAVSESSFYDMCIYSRELTCIYSCQRPSHDQTLWLGTQNGRSCCGETRGRAFLD